MVLTFTVDVGKGCELSSIIKYQNLSTLSKFNLKSKLLSTKRLEVVSSAVHRGFETRSGQTKDYKIGICCFCAKHSALTGKSKDWLARK